MISKEKYEDYLSEIDFLMELSSSNDVQKERLHLLCLAIKEYEDARFWFDTPTALEGVKHLMKERGLKQKDLMFCFKGKGRVSEFLSGKRGLTINDVRNLHDQFKIPLSILIKL